MAPEPRDRSTEMSVLTRTILATLFQPIVVSDDSVCPAVICTGLILADIPALRNMSTTGTPTPVPSITTGAPAYCGRCSVSFTRSTMSG